MPACIKLWHMLYKEIGYLLYYSYHLELICKTPFKFKYTFNHYRIYVYNLKKALFAVRIKAL